MSGNPIAEKSIHLCQIAATCECPLLDALDRIREVDLLDRGIVFENPLADHGDCIKKGLHIRPDTFHTKDACAWCSVLFFKI